MGLDMYLYAKKHNYQSGWRAQQQNLALDYPQELDKFQIPMSERGISTTVRYDIGYWRKVNAIHNWFVEHCAEGVDECQPIDVSLGALKELQTACVTVLAAPDQAEDLLPTQSGFFFGGTEYDDYYLEGIRYTLGVVKSAIELLESPEGQEYEIEYQASW